MPVAPPSPPPPGSPTTPEQEKGFPPRSGSGISFPDELFTDTCRTLGHAFVEFVGQQMLLLVAATMSGVIYHGLVESGNRRAAYLFVAVVGAAVFFSAYGRWREFLREFGINI